MRREEISNLENAYRHAVLWLAVGVRGDAFEKKLAHEVGSSISCGLDCSIDQSQADASILAGVVKIGESSGSEEPQHMRVIGAPSAVVVTSDECTRDEFSS